MPSYLSILGNISPQKWEKSQILIYLYTKTMSKYPIGKVELLLGWICNQNCIFCSVGHNLTQSKKVKSLEIYF
jgi:hypothetical protein